MRNTAPTVECQICKRHYAPANVMPAAVLREAIVAEIRKTHPDWQGDGYICRDDLNRFRNAYIQSMIEAEKGELSSLDRDVLESMIEHDTLSVVSQSTQPDHAPVWTVEFADPVITTRYRVDGRSREIIDAVTRQRRSGLTFRLARAAIARGR